MSINKRSEKRRSKWSQGVEEYKNDLLEFLQDANLEITEVNLLNGAKDWTAYSWGGCSLIHDGDIAKRLATPSELKRTANGEKKPNAREEWLDVQARALYQASRLILEGVK